MIMLKSRRELEIMREAGRISARALQLAGEVIARGLPRRTLTVTSERLLKVRALSPASSATTASLRLRVFP